MKQHILLVDDDKDEIKILTEALQDAGINCKCTWATGPAHALEMLKYLKTDFIFIDYNMPKMNGIDCIHEIRQLPAYAHVPVVLYSNNIDDETHDTAIAAGATACLQKTNSIRELCRLLQELIEKVAA